MRNHLADLETNADEAVLGKGEAHARTIADSVLFLIAYVDKNHRFRFNNKTFLDWFGAHQRELEGKHVREFLGAEEYEKILPRIQAVLEESEQLF